MTSILFLTSMLTLGADYLQSRAILNSNGQYIEVNPLITQRSIDAYFGTAAALNTAVLFIDDEDTKRSIFVSVTAIQAHYVFKNRSIGIRATLRF